MGHESKEARKQMRDPRIGVIGGTGIYAFPDVEILEEVSLDTPFGKPSDSFLVCRLEGREAVFLPRHGKGHRLLPSELNFRANIWGMKKLGVERIIALSAVGSLKEDIHPGDFVVVDQFFDRTRGRMSTFFGRGIAAHVHFADPVCPELSKVLADSAEAVGKKVHRGGTYVCMEGPQFSTRAESFFYRTLGASVIGMTNLQEAKLSREAEICYVTVALVTDYDCWHETEEDVSVEAILRVLKENAESARAMVREALKRIPRERNKCNCGEALKNCIVTDPSLIPEETKRKLELLVKKYL